MLQLLVSAVAEWIVQVVLEGVWGTLKAILAALVALFRRFREGFH